MLEEKKMFYSLDLFNFEAGFGPHDDAGCISSSKLSDFTSDCPDGADEASCGEWKS